MDFSVIQKANISPAEFGFLAGVARSTAHKWVVGKAKPHAQVRELVAVTLDTLNKAVESGALPLKLGTRRADRKQELLDVMAAHS